METVYTLIRNGEVMWFKSKIIRDNNYRSQDSCSSFTLTSKEYEQLEFED